MYLEMDSSDNEVTVLERKTEKDVAINIGQNYLLKEESTYCNWI